MNFPAKSLFAKRYFSTAARLAHCMTVGILTPDGRVKFRNLSDRLGYADIKPELSRRSIDEIVDSDVKLQMFMSPTGEWSASTDEMAIINMMVVSFQPRALFEFGTYDGRTTLNLDANAPSDATIYTLDLPPTDRTLPGRTVGEVFHRIKPRTNIQQLFGNSLEFDFSPYAGQIDFVFIDAGHAYENVKNDTAAALQLVEGRTHSVILWHDYETIHGVTRAVDELISEHKSSAAHFVQIENTSLACLIRDGS